LLINLPILEKETTDGLAKLANDTQQRVALLNALRVDVGSEILVNILENKLPKNKPRKNGKKRLKKMSSQKLTNYMNFCIKLRFACSTRSVQTG